MSKIDDGAVSRAADGLTADQIRAIRTDEMAVEYLPFRDRDEIIGRGIARRAWPGETGSGDWRTWLTPLGLQVRDMIAARSSGGASDG